MTFAVGPLNGWLAAEAKITVPRVAVWPMAGVRGERDDLFGSGDGVSVGEGGCPGARRGGLFFRYRLDAEGSGRLFFSATVGPGGDRDGGLLNLCDCNRPSG